jgi:hypothetical protein
MGVRRVLTVEDAEDTENRVLRVGAVDCDLGRLGNLVGWDRNLERWNPREIQVEEGLRCGASGFECFVA